MHSNSMKSKCMIIQSNHVLCEDVRGSMGVGDHLLIGDGTTTVGTPTQLSDFDLER